jgi:hypothetical protein
MFGYAEKIEKYIKKIYLFLLCIIAKIIYSKK